MSQARRFTTPELVAQWAKQCEMQDLVTESPSRINDALNLAFNAGASRVENELQAVIDNLKAALEGISAAHKFNMATLPPSEVHSLVFDALERHDSLMKAIEGGAPLAPTLIEKPTWEEFVERACANIKAADDAAADSDYMLDSDNCISVLRGTWQGPVAQDMPPRPNQS